MPGRQSTGAPAPKKLKTRNRKKERSFNALAIAEQQNPTDSKVRPSRLGVLEGDSTKRARYEEEDNSEQTDLMHNVTKRRKGEKGRFGTEVEVGSDSDGNHWVTGQVDSDDDSDLDSNEAMGESDDEKFVGYKFGSSSAVNSKKIVEKNSRRPDLSVEHIHDVDLREDGDGRQSDEESDDFGDDAVDLADMLDESDSDRRETPKLKAGGRNSPDASKLKTGVSALTGSGLSDEEDSILLDSEADDDVENSSKLTSLQAFVTNMEKKDQNMPNHFGPFIDAQESMNPSEFGLSSKKKLTVADLIPSVVDPRLKRSLKLLAGNESTLTHNHRSTPKKLEVPLPKRQQDRLDRAAAYEKSKETLNRWIDTVKHNRRAEHLSFPLKNPNAAVAQGSQRLLSKIHSQPLTGLESAIQNILADSGILSTEKDSADEQADAFNELPTNKISLEEFQARRAELRRARELLFREETRSKRIKKIKSKSYRRIHRKERERNTENEMKALAAAGVDNSESENERNDRRRAEERMGARHRESKWARGVKESGRAAWDVDARGGVTEMARRGDDLRRRIAGKGVGSDGESLDSSELESDDEVETRAKGQDQALPENNLRRLRMLDKKGDQLGDIGTSTSNLSSMKFMKNADALRKKRNDADIELLRREIAGEESQTDQDAKETVGRRSYGPVKKTHAPVEETQREKGSEFEEGDFSDTSDQHLPGSFVKKEQEMQVNDAGTTREDFPSSKSTRVLKSTDKTREHARTMQLETSENPWLSGSKNLRHNRKTRDSEAATIISNYTPAKMPITLDSDTKVRTALKYTDGEKKTLNELKIAETDIILKENEVDNEDEDDVRLPFVLRNQDLVRKAFAGDDVVAEFEKEKEQTMHDEEEKVVDNTLPGWGNWTGAGISKKEQKRNKGRVLTKTAGIKRDERQDAKLDRVIINEKRFKKVGEETRGQMLKSMLLTLIEY